MDFSLCLFPSHPSDLITPIKLDVDTYHDVPPREIFPLKRRNHNQLEKGAESGKLQELAITCCIYGIFRARNPAPTSILILCHIQIWHTCSSESSQQSSDNKDLVTVTQVTIYRRRPH
jgi:hypothetical protein